jgi:hypothetical protein
MLTHGIPVGVWATTLTGLMHMAESDNNNNVLMIGRRPITMVMSIMMYVVVVIGEILR